MNEITLPKLSWQVIFNRAVPHESRGWGRVRAAQVAEMGPALTIAVWGQTFNALLLALILRGSVPAAFLALWLSSLAALVLLTLPYRQQWAKRDLQSLSRRAIDRAAYHSVLFGIFWSLPVAFFFSKAGTDAQLAISVVTMSTMAGAAFLFRTVPPVAGAYVVLLGGAMTNMLFQTQDALIWLMGPVYTAGLMAIVLSNGRLFMQRKCVELALEERTETVSLLLREYENSDADWLWQTNRTLCFQNVSPRFARAIGRTAVELEGTSIVELLQDACALGPSWSRPLQQVIASINRRQPISEVIVPIAGAGGIRCIELSARPRYNRNRRFIGYRGVGSDVTEARKAAERIEHMARHDALTGLPNRLLLTEAIGEALDQAIKADGACAVLLLDLDRFKTVNDSIGHVAGDHLLQQVSSRFGTLVSRDMTAGRLGGDEFAVVIPGAGTAEEVERLAREVIDAMRQPFIYEGQHLFVGASIGVALGPVDGNSVEELVRNADLALYRAKDEGGNGVRFYEPGLHAAAEERRRLELAMRSALDEGEFSLAYQPVMDAATSRIEGFEALLRWTNAELGSIPPAKLIPIAEETGLLGRIGEWVLRSACAEAAAWPDATRLSVNISPCQLQEPGFMMTLISALSQSGLEPQRLELEITETVFLNVTPLTRKVLHQIRGLGVRLAIDDFGTGYSSLGYLKKGNFDTLKIDRSFVGSASPADPESTAIIKAVVALSGSLGMTTVAEGVETQEQLAVVRDLGCDRVQGYIFSNPLSAEAARALLRGGRRRAA